MSEQKTRGHEHAIEINAPIELVWKAISNAAELTRWYVQDAKVDEQEGGKYWVSWGGDQEGSSFIKAFEPNKRLLLAQEPFDGSDGCGGKIKTKPEKPIMEEFVLEARGEVTILRLINSGIPAAADWDGFYDGTDIGWDQFFRQLRHYVEKHAGTPREKLTIMRPVPADAWTRLLGPDGLCAQGSFEGLEAGDRYQVTTAFGDTLSGQVVFRRADDVLELTIAEYDDAYLSLAFMGNTRTSIWVELGTFGYGESEAMHAKWNAWLDALLPAPAPTKT